jgi:hypothetical protein
MLVAGDGYYEKWWRRCGGWILRRVSFHSYARIGRTMVHDKIPNFRRSRLIRFTLVTLWIGDPHEVLMLAIQPHDSHACTRHALE